MAEVKIVGKPEAMCLLAMAVAVKRTQEDEKKEA